MTWQLYIAITIITFSFCTILQRVILKDNKTDPMAFSLFFQLMIGLLIGAFTLLTVGFDFTNWQTVIFNLAASTIIYAFANITQFQALKRIEASRYTVIFATRVFFTILASSIFLQEGLTPLQFLGTALVLAGVIIVTLKRGDKLKFSLGEGLTLVAAGLIGLANTNDRVIVSSLPVSSYVCIAFLLPAIFTAVVFPKAIVRMKPLFSLALFPKMLVLCVLFASSALTFFSALQLGPNSSQVVSLNLTSVIVIVLLSIILLKERDHIGRKLLGAALSFTGVLLLA